MTHQAALLLVHPPKDAPQGITTGTAGVRQAGAASPRRTIWDHNGSEMYLTGESSTRKIFYARPRKAIESAGVRPGTLLFAGERSGSVYRGIAHVFSNRCGKFYYEVSGRVEASDVKIVLTGKAPSTIDANCKPTNMRDDTLVFTYLRTEAS